MICPTQQVGTRLILVLVRVMSGRSRQNLKIEVISRGELPKSVLMLISHVLMRSVRSNLLTMYDRN